MATAKQKAWRAKFARLYGRKKKRKTKSRKAPRSSPKRVRTVARRRRRSAPRRRGGFRKKYITISLLNVGQLAMQYSNLTGRPLGAILDKLTGAILQNQGDIFEVIIDEMLAAVKNVTDNPFQVAAKGAVIAGFFAIIRSFAGHKKILSLGKFRVTV